MPGLAPCESHCRSFSSAFNLCRANIVGCIEYDDCILLWICGFQCMGQCHLAHDPFMPCNGNSIFSFV